PSALTVGAPRPDLRDPLSRNLPQDLVQTPAHLGARIIALHHLASAKSAAKRLHRGSDKESLHDFRVALRRLRTNLKAYLPLVEDSVRKRFIKEVGEIQDATGAARDAEVQLILLRRARSKLGPDARRFADFLTNALRKTLSQNKHQKAVARFRNLE